MQRSGCLLPLALVMACGGSSGGGAGSGAEGTDSGSGSDVTGTSVDTDQTNAEPFTVVSPDGAVTLEFPRERCLLV